MRGALTRLFLGMAALALVAGCKAEPPSKPCPCTKADGCRCPLPAPKSSTSLPVPPKAPTVKVARSAHRHSHIARHERHRENREARIERGEASEARAEDRENRESTGERESGGATGGRGTRRQREDSGYGGAFAYGYHSESRSYSVNEGDRSERSSARQRYRDDEGSRSGGGYSDEGPERDKENQPESGYAMSINAPSAQDSWHGYDVDCPNANADK